MNTLTRSIVVLLLAFLSIGAAKGSDTLSVMVYNLLYYGEYTSFCTRQNNPIDAKDQHLRTIVNHVQPDIIAVNEMGRDQHNVSRILSNVLNFDSNIRYRSASFTNTAGSSIVNMLFFREDRLALKSEAVIANHIRDINLYSLYLLTPELILGDTIFIHAIVAHLKAGGAVSDQQTRLVEVQAAMGYIAQRNLHGNLLFMGDFNMNSSYEQAYGLLTYHPNEAIRFFDPIDKPGVWYNNPDMAPYHTQSPRTGSHPCFVTGGLDDRYDQILVSQNILSGMAGLQYLEGSYRAIGQDGNRFNRSLIDPPNESEPPEVIDALYNMSDHLPVIMQMVRRPFSLNTGIAPWTPVYGLQVLDARQGNIRFSVDFPPGQAQVVLYASNARELVRSNINIHTSGEVFDLPTTILRSGLYVLQVRDGRGNRVSTRLIIP